MLNVENLTIQYLYGNTAIKNLSFSCGYGEKIAVFSRSEGGKTSLLKCIAGLIPIKEGRIIIDGKDAAKAPVKARDVQMLYEDGGAMPWKSVKFHLTYPLRLRKVKREERNAIAEAAAKDFNIYPVYGYLTRYLFEDDILRLAFARTAVRKAKVTLIDNPFSRVKSAYRKELFMELLPKIRTLSGAVLFATDSLDEAMTVGDKIIFLHYGLCMQIGTVNELKESPASLEVDKTFNPARARNNTVLQQDENGVYASVFNEKIYVNGIPAEREVIVSYGVALSSDGVDVPPASYRYENGAFTVAFPSGGEITTVPPAGESYNISVAKGNIHFFDALTEKRLTTVIKE